MQYAGNFQPAAQNWTTVQPGYLEHFQRTTKHVTTAGGTQVVDLQQPQGSGLSGRIHRSSSGLGNNAHTRWSSFQLANEPLIAEYPAKTSYGVNSALKGWIYVSQNNFGWISAAENGRIVTTLIPFFNIVEVVPSQRIKAAKKNYTFQPLEAGNQRSKAAGFQIFTKDMLVYQFFGLKKSEEFFNHLFGAMGRVGGPLANIDGYANGLSQPFAQAALAPGHAMEANRENSVLLNQAVGGQTAYAQPLMQQQPILQQQVLGGQTAYVQPLMQQQTMLQQPILQQHGAYPMTSGNHYSTGMAMRYAAENTNKYDNRVELGQTVAPVAKFQQ